MEKMIVVEVRFSYDIFEAPRNVVIYEGTQDECEKFLRAKYVPNLKCAGTDVFITKK